MIPGARQSVKTRRHIARLLDVTDATTIASWLTELHLNDPLDPSTQTVVDEYNMALVHSWQGNSLLPVESISTELESSVKACATCHAAAVASWVKSRHFGAYDTLTQRGRHKDARCISCHTNSIGGDGSITGETAHLAVTCNSCHGSDDPKDACVDCHTATTDPDKHYAAALKSICQGKHDTTSGLCER